jgi:hypothetical protein
MIFRVRQKQTYYEDFEVSAVSAYEAIALVDSASVESLGAPEYLETTNTYILADDGIFAAKHQPENATPDTPESV